MKFCTFVLGTGEERAGWIQSPTHVVDMHHLTHGVLPDCLIDFLQDSESNLAKARAAAAALSDTESLDNGLKNGLKNGLDNGLKDGSDNGLDSRLGHALDHVEGVFRMADVRLKSPLPRPASVRDFYAFENHVKTARRNRGLEMVPEWYQFPVFYFSNHQAVIGPEEDVEIPPGCNAFDYELELACVIGCKGRDIAADVAESYIFGYCVMNDWSARDIQREEVKVGLGPAKGKDFATALGPYIVTPDELEPYQVGNRYDLTMTATVNGVPLSRGNYQDIYFPMQSLIERASAGVTLYPGDVIGTGTVGTGCILELGPTVHRWLQPGDVVELSVTGLGVLRNRVVAGAKS